MIKKGVIIKSKKEYLEKIECSPVPKIVWCFWDGLDMSVARKESLNVMAMNIGVPICLITDDNLYEFLLPDYPLHEAYKYLSSVHKSDYIRIYLLHLYGGCWHDVKQTEILFEPYWDIFKDESIFLIGKKEVKNGGANIIDNEGRWMRDFEADLVSCCYFIFRQNTIFSKELFDSLNSLLDKNLLQLIKNPPKNPYDSRREKTSRWFLINLIKKKGYPIDYTMFGNIFHPLVLKYKKNVNNTLPHDKELNLGKQYR